MRTIFLLLAFLSAMSFADTENITKKTPLTPPDSPKKYNGDPKNCQKISEIEFLDTMNRDIKYKDEKYRVSSQIDLNLDGVCEILAYQKYVCGSGGCSSDAFQLVNNSYKHIGSGFNGVTLLEPLNGWLQASSYGKNGWCCHTLTFISYINGKYQSVRRDVYRAKDSDDHKESPNQEYTETEYLEINKNPDIYSY